MSKKSTTEEFTQKANEIHGSNYDYSLVKYINNETKVKIICPEHGVFVQRPIQHLIFKHICPSCSKNKKLTVKEFIYKANLIHNNTYNYSLTHFINTKTKIKIICPIHEVFEQKPDNHLNGHGCPKCGGKIKLNTNEFINKSNLKHDYKYDYSNVIYTNSKNKIIIICPNHGIFEQTPTSHLMGRGCPRCLDSKGEKEIKEFLREKKIKFIHQHKFNDCKNIFRLSFDFYLPDLNMCVEYNGKQHYKPISVFGGEKAFNKQIVRDNIKIEYCKNNNIPLMIIKYNDVIKDKLKELY